MSTSIASSGDFAARAARIQPSPVRAVFDLSMAPGMISLAGGNPDVSALPMDQIAEFAREIIAEHGATALQYGVTAGTEALRALVGEVMAAEGNAVSPANVQVTAGSQNGLDLVTKLFVDPGDVILAEGPTYVGALTLFEAFEAEVRHVPMDEGGMQVERLGGMIDALRAEGRTVKFIYTIPNFQNPGGVSMSEERRDLLVRVAREKGVRILEDNPYGLLSFDGHYRTALLQRDRENVIYLGSFSKIFAPGLRVGWVVAPDDVRTRLGMLGEDAVVCPPVLSQLLAERYVTSFDWKRQIDTYAGIYRGRCQALLGALEEHMPEGTTWTRPEGGFFTWLTLPEGISVDALLGRAIEDKVVFVPGSAFYASGAAGAGANQLRLSFSFVPEDTLREGGARLGRAIRSAEA